MSRRLSRAILPSVATRPRTVSRKMRSVRGLKCVWCTLRTSGTVNATHQAAVMTKAICMPVPMLMPTFSPKSTMARHAMNGMHEPM